jgi:DNA-binding beta-propeller fold protein YncE
MRRSTLFVAAALLCACLVHVGCSHRAAVMVEADDAAIAPDGPVWLDSGPDLHNPAASSYIYVIDETNLLLRFDPLKLTFAPVGRPNCPVSSYPHSMAVDHGGMAWVNYHSHDIFLVSTKDASCAPSGIPRAHQGFQVFGMGFVSDSPSTTSEQLYICGREFTPTASVLARVDPVSLAFSTVGKVSTVDVRTPEFTGTGSGALYAYFPGKTKSIVALLDKTNGKSLKTWPVPAAGAEIRTWAFAHWGGQFYIFVSTQFNAKVLRLDPGSGKVITLLSNTKYYIVGAGVTVRAPLTRPDAGAGVP